MRTAPASWVKTLTVYPKQSLSLQTHQGRSEHWVVVRGEAFISLDGGTKVLGRGDHVYIPANSPHRLINHGDEVLEVIEVAIGECDENDIVRLEDQYGRG